MGGSYSEYLLESLSGVFSHLRGENSRDIAESLFSRFGSLEMAFCAPYSELERKFGKNVTLYIKTLAEITSRGLTDRFDFGKVHSEREICEYFKALYLPAECEKVYAMFIRDDGTLLRCVKISDGTINSADITVRKIVEEAIGCSCSRVILAHNHPGGEAKPSTDDVTMLKTTGETLAYAGISLEYSVIVAGWTCDVLCFDEE